jgi:DNA-directed RNA polymerase subunit omega
MLYAYHREGDKMIYPSIDKLLNLVDSKYKLVHIASRRSKEIDATGHLQMTRNKYTSEKSIGMALEELAEGYITVVKEEDKEEEEKELTE